MDFEGSKAKQLLGGTIEEHDVASAESNFNFRIDRIVNRAEFIAGQQIISHFQADGGFFAGRHGAINFGTQIAIFVDGDILASYAQNKVIGSNLRIIRSV